MDVDMNR